MDPESHRSSAEIPGYRLVREVGRGAMGIVYESEHTVLGRRVALKLLNPAWRGNATATARFLREGRVAARLRHPHVIDVLDAGTCEAGPFLVMEYVDGPTLAEYLRQSPGIPPGRAVELLLPILSALLHAHGAGVVHRDVKPANILIARDRFGDPLPKIGDFGLGKSLDENGDGSLTRDGIVGSLPYMAPEQVRDAKSVDARADQYSLAALLYEAVAGRLPFEAPGAFALMEAICGGCGTPLLSAAPGVSRSFAEVIERAMSRRVEDRYPSLSVMGQELLVFSSGRSWASWAREFGEPPADALGNTYNDALSLAAEARAVVGPKRAGRPVWRRGLLPLVTFGLGAGAACGVVRAERAVVRPTQTVVESIAPQVTGRPAESLEALNQSFSTRGPPASAAAEPAPVAERSLSRPPALPSPPAAAPVRPNRPASSANAAPSGSHDLGANHAPIIE